MLYKKQNGFFKIFLIAVICTVQFSCEKKTPTDLAVNAVIPAPVSVTATHDAFMLTDNTDIYVPGESDELKHLGQYLADHLNPSTGFGMEVKTTDKEPGSGNIYLVLKEDTQLGDEGYELVIKEDLLKVTANKPAGLFYGIQTIRQLLPPDVESDAVQKGPWDIATGTIRDYPEFPFRGSMMDVARHFFGVDDMKRYMDLIAYYKMNVLHLHLTDDQGWRIQIKSWPKLAEYGGSTEVGGGEGGYYTQEQYKDLVQYAAERYITIIPEVDMPGHTNAALASYPELNCSARIPKLYSETEVGFSSLCTRQALTYKFIDDVVGELAAITPGPYFHVGGDESHATKKEDYIPFVDSVQKIVQRHGKIMIGWEETAQASLNDSSIAQFWTNPEYAKLAVSNGIKLIMSPAPKTYLDMKYDSTTKLGQNWAAYIEVDSAYQWDPATLVPGISKQNIIGVEAPLWTETVTNMDEIEYLVFPRLPGYAEIGWSAPSAREWEKYKVRLGKQAARFDALGIDYYPSKKISWVAVDSLSR